MNYEIDLEDVVTRDESGRLHSFNDRPAIHDDEGALRWYKHGLLHRDDGPAVEHLNGYRESWVDGVFIRAHGADN